MSMLVGVVQVSPGVFMPMCVSFVMLGEGSRSLESLKSVVAIFFKDLAVPNEQLRIGKG